jgi:glycosyltransferase involved in cell wall biosynthesis
MERLSIKGHDIQVIDYKVRWQKNWNRRIISKRRNVVGYHKVLQMAMVDVITPSFVQVPIFDYISLIITHRIEIQKQINSFKPDIIIGFGILNSSIAIKLAKKNKIPFVYYVIDELHRLVPQKSLHNLARTIEISNLQKSDRVITISKGLGSYCEKMGVRKDKISVISAGVDIESFSKANGNKIREDYGIVPSDTLLFFMGWLYNFSGLIEVIKSLADIEKCFKLMIVGRGDLWDRIDIEIKRQGLEGRVFLLGWKPYDEIKNYLKAADICILPSQNDNIMLNIVPIKIYEYMAASKPIVSTRLPGLEMEFGHQSGIVYVETPNLVVSKTEQIVNCKLVEELSKNAYSCAKKSDWESITNDFERTLIDCVMNGNGAR